MGRVRPSCSEFGRVSQGYPADSFVFVYITHQRCRHRCIIGPSLYFKIIIILLLINNNNNYYYSLGLHVFLLRRRSKDLNVQIQINAFAINIQSI